MAGSRRRVVSGQPVPPMVTPRAQLAPLYGGSQSVDMAVQNARDIARQVYPTMSPELQQMFPEPNFDAYGQPIDTMEADIRGGGAFFNRAIPGEDTPYGNTLVIDPATGELMPQAVERAITDSLISDEAGVRNVPIGDSGLTPRDVDMALAQLRRRGVGGGPMVDANPGAISMATGLSPDDVAIGEFADPGSGFGSVIDSSIDDAEMDMRVGTPADADIRSLTPGAPPAGLSIKTLLALRNLPPQVRKFLGPRMGMLPSLAAGAVGVGGAMSGDRDRPSMSTDATMRAPQMY